MLSVTERWVSRMIVMRVSVELALAPMVIVFADRFAFVRELVPVGQAFLDDELLERREPMVVVPAAGVGFAGGLGYLARGAPAARPHLH